MIMIILVYCGDEFDCVTVGCGMTSYNGESLRGHSLISPRPEEVTQSHSVILDTRDSIEDHSGSRGYYKEHTWVINPTLIAHFEFSSKSSPIQPPQWNSRKSYFTFKSFPKMYKMDNTNWFMALKSLYWQFLMNDYLLPIPSTVVFLTRKVKANIPSCKCNVLMNGKQCEKPRALPEHAYTF